MGHEVDSGNCQRKQNKCSNSKMEFWAVHWSLRISDKTTFI